MKKLQDGNAVINYESSFNRFLNQYQQIFIDNFANYENGFQLLSIKYNAILKEKELKNESEAWNFSIFDIVKIKRLEEDLHSPLLAELLDTKGSHGQKDLFYKLFLYEIIGEEKAQKFINKDYQEYSIKTEEHIKNETDRGRIDLTIQSTDRHNKFAIILENKWKCKDSCSDQLYKYYRNYTNPNGRAYTDNNLIVIYLTIHGVNPTWIENKEFELFLTNNKGINYFPISYIHIIKNWLEKCMISCQSEKVKYLIEQYLNNIKYDNHNRR
jgi:hypothetical protein